MTKSGTDFTASSSFVRAFTQDSGLAYENLQPPLPIPSRTGPRLLTTWTHRHSQSSVASSHLAHACMSSTGSTPVSGFFRTVPAVNSSRGASFPMATITSFWQKILVSGFSVTRGRKRSVFLESGCFRRWSSTDHFCSPLFCGGTNMRPNHALDNRAVKRCLSRDTANPTIRSFRMLDCNPKRPAGRVADRRSFLIWEL
jgi:hypothetical protein